MKGFAILWAVIFALVMVLNIMIMRTAWGDLSFLLDVGYMIWMILTLAGISFLLSAPIFLLWMGIRYLASKWGGS